MLESFKELNVWQKSMQMAATLMKLCETFLKEQRYILSAQIQRAAISIPSNIAEGYNRKSRREYVQFLAIAYGSAGELETQCLLARDLKYIDDKASMTVLTLINEIEKMLKSMLQKLQQKEAA